MDDRATVKQLTSVRLQKAINKNQNFDLELKKELQVLEVKKKASEKAFEQRRTQFLKHRLCLEPIKKSHSFHRSSNGSEKWRQERAKVSGLLDLRNCYSTGNLLEYLLSSRNDPSYANESSSEEREKLFKKFSLDSAKDDGGKQSDSLSKNWGKTLGEPHSWKDKKIPKTKGINVSKNEADRGYHIYGTSFENLRVPSFGNKLSFSDDNLSDKTSKQGRWLKSCDAPSRLAIPPIADPLSKSDECLSSKDKNITNQRKHLSLPPLTRTRSKSLEVLRDLPENKTESKSGGKDIKDTRKLSWTDATKMQRVKTNSWLSVEQQPLKKQEAGHGGKEEGDMNSKSNKMERSSSTPDLLDIEPEVEYLLLKDDKIRLRRMRASLHAIRVMGDMKEYRYIRNVEFAHQNKQETNPQTDKVSGNDYPDHAQMHGLKFEAQSQATQDIPARDVGDGLVHAPEQNNLEGEGAEKCEQKPNGEREVFDAANIGEEASTEEEDRLNSSAESTLAEMFDEIKHTRYLRVRPRMSSGDPDDEDDDSDDNSCNISYGYRVPLIIVGHTKAVMTPDDS